MLVGRGGGGIAMQWSCEQGTLLQANRCRVQCVRNCEENACCVTPGQSLTVTLCEV
jgi:hypothetical protein